MSLPLILGFLWLVTANLAAMLPSRSHQERAVPVLIALGIPLLGWLTWASGPLWGLMFLLGGASALRWPLVWLWHRPR
ncbi:DUF2484 family protein [Pseudogemmobacter humi]|uniref:DUF2484 family protein n=1 Tax=Pseudogemmobacter humi TaxID=2483812 RepID=A0A3P5XM51_9RHOB|nr:DUF2484 family protein [Pseudogemmobacter humi]VDC31322.1 hypothetical protein XINFAN_02817 [Pseudogemmobacter humi]